MCLFAEPLSTRVHTFRHSRVYHLEDTMIRLLLILTLLWQPFAALGIAGARAPGSAEHACEISCCQVVERTTCCGEQIAAEYCARSGGACSCVASPERQPTPRPEVPLTRSHYEVVFLVSAERPELMWEAMTVARPTGPTGCGALIAGRSHNVQQAFLGIWRT